jgi:hypothetical protein
MGRGVVIGGSVSRVNVGDRVGVGVGRVAVLGCVGGVGREGHLMGNRVVRVWVLH